MKKSKMKLPSNKTLYNGGITMKNKQNKYVWALNFENDSSCKTDAQKLAHDFADKTYIDKEGVIRWINNNKVPSTEILEFWQFLNKPFDMERSVAAYKSQLSHLFVSMSKQTLSEEQMLEVKGAFGNTKSFSF